jgi:site-specific DNA-cytosine methylase
MNAIGVFIYAGGFTLGIQRAGFNVLGHFEDPKPYAKATMQRNLNLDVFPYPDWPSPREQLGQPIELIYANPPCCAFSQMGRSVKLGRDAWRTHPALACTRQVFSLLEREQPHILAWESVLNSLSHGSEFIAGFAERAIELGYQFTMVPHNAYHMGSIQSRTRIMYVCSKTQFFCAEPDYDRTETVEERLAGIDYLKGGETYDGEKFMAKYGYLLEYTKPGKTLYQAFNDLYEDKTKADPFEALRNEKGNVSGRPAMAGPYRLYQDRTCLTVAGFPFVHYDGTRLCRVNEMAALADYPPDWEWLCRGSGVVNEMARGVSSKVGEWLGISCKETIEQNEACKPGLNFIDLRKPPGERKGLEHFCKGKNIPLSTFWLEDPGLIEL